MVKELKLKVAEAIQDDVNKGIIKIDSAYMKELGVRAGDIIEINDDYVPQSEYYSPSNKDTKAEGIVFKNYDKQMIN